MTELPYPQIVEIFILSVATFFVVILYTISDGIVFRVAHSFSAKIILEGLGVELKRGTSEKKCGAPLPQLASLGTTCIHDDRRPLGIPRGLSLIHI